MNDSFLKKIIRNSDDISIEDYFSFLQKVIENKADKSEVIAFVAALSAKPLRVKDLVYFVRFIESVSPPKEILNSNQAINIVGTGGGIATFNISTTSAFIASAAGAKVLKSGSYRYNSQSGSLDVLTALGLNIHLNLQALEKMLAETGIGFINPNMYSPLLRRLAIAILPLELKDIGGFINTIGPLICPVHVKGQITGVSHYRLFEIISEAMNALKFRNHMVVWSEIGLDELSSIGKNHIAHIHHGIEKQIIGQETHGLDQKGIQDLAGGDPSHNAEIMKAIFENKIKNQALDIVLLNSAYILLLAKTVSNVEEGIELSKDVISSGSVKKQLENAIEFTNDYR